MQGEKIVPDRHEWARMSIMERREDRWRSKFVVASKNCEGKAASGAVAVTSVRSIGINVQWRIGFILYKHFAVACCRTRRRGLVLLRLPRDTVSVRHRSLPRISRSGVSRTRSLPAKHDPQVLGMQDIAWRHT
eukprot:6204764-Pleurochrysis_carterae.AAC.1